MIDNVQKYLTSPVQYCWDVFLLTKQRMASGLPSFLHNA
jgi:hypothetical protein